MKKVIKITINDKNKEQIVEAKGLSADKILHFLSITLVKISINCGVTKKLLLEAVRKYYEDEMRIIANGK